jgi:hypothetical protein
VDADLRLVFPRELARSRRSGLAVSVIAAPTATELEAREVLDRLRHHLRRYDHLGAVDGAVVVVVAPDTDRAEAGLLVGRLDIVLPPLGLAVAPEDGDDLEALVQLALDRSVITPGGVS